MDFTRCVSLYEVHIRHKPERFLQDFAPCAQDAGALWIIDLLAAHYSRETFLPTDPKELRPGDLQGQVLNNEAIVRTVITFGLWHSASS